MIKNILVIMLLAISTKIAMAETCSAVIKDRYNSTIDRYTESSYSKEAACDQAMYQCNRALSDARSQGRMYDANCEIESIFNPAPNPYPNPYPTPWPSTFRCTSDLVDQWNRVIRSFESEANSEWEACRNSESICNQERNRYPGYGVQCITRRGGEGPRPIPTPGRIKTESCEVGRFDPAGRYIQSYFAQASGPLYEDVKSRACNEARFSCERELRGRQYCNILR